MTRIDDGPEAASEPPRGGRGRRTALIALAVVVVAAVAVVGALGLGGGGDEGADAPPRTGSLVEVVRATLTERTQVDGQLGYGTEIPLPVKATGTVTGLPEAGTTAKRGDTLLRVDDRPVVLLYGSLPMYRDLGLTTTAPGGDTAPGGGTTASGEGKTDGGTGGGAAASPSAPPARTGTGTAAVTELEGMDVLQFETNLAALGYTGFTVDERFTDRTADAVERWQKSLGIPETGRVGIGDVIYSAGKVRIGRPGVRLGEAVTENALTYTGTARKVVVDASAADASWAVRGAAVRVRLPDGKTVGGEVASVGRQASAPEGGSGEDGSGQGGATVPVTVTIEDQKSVGRLESGPVTVEYVGREAKDVLTVPVAALVALAEGGHGLETADGGFVAVKTGLFADGKVEVSGSAVRAGLKVRIPE
ncbi:peptidoglycan-binding domain-containing protein [Streptomyces sp. NPDC000931]|uniref:peptidoglycan-binding domain-containing protein n=1 Tax=Streptomyces sp. NPDC000931 TaxID=3154372 RepID=UPI00332DD32A